MAASKATIVLVGLIMYSMDLIDSKATTNTPAYGDEEGSGSPGDELATKPPHIVFILADDLGYNDIGYHAIHGMSAVRTPHLDALAADGVKLENYYVQSLCSPSRSVLMTGRYLIRYGLQHDVFRAAQPTCLPLSETILPQKLKEQGYATHAIGKWHLGMCRTECLPTRRGFDSFFGYPIGGSDYYHSNKTFIYPGETRKDAIHMKGLDLWENETPVLEERNGEYGTTLFTRKAVDIIQRHDPEKPLFLYQSYKSPHRPLQVPDEYYQRFKHVEDNGRRIMAAMISVLDEGVKNITDALKNSGLWDNTFLVFSSDNGGRMGTTTSGNNWPLRGSKWTSYEGGIRAVAFVNSPLLSQSVRGTVNTELMHISDWLPTFVDGLAGGKTIEMSKPLDGFNMWDTISNGTPSPREEFLINIDPLFKSKQTLSERKYWGNLLRNRDDLFRPFRKAGIRRGDWKLITGRSPEVYWYAPPESDLQDDHLQDYLCGDPNPSVQLFNIMEDPNETCNVARKPENVEIVLDLLRRLRTYYKESAPVYFPKLDFNANPEFHGGVWRPWLDDDIDTYEKLHR